MNNRKGHKFISPRNPKPSAVTGPNPNNQTVLTVGSASSRANPNVTMLCEPRRRFNENICMSTTMRKAPAIPKRDENSELQLTFLYNDYLQSLMQQLMIEQKFEKDKGIWNGQLRHYEDLLESKQKELDTIINDTKSVEKRREVIEILSKFEEALKQIQILFEGHNIQEYLEKFKEILQSESQKLYLKNVKPLRSQEDFDRFKHVMGNLQSTLEKFLDSGVDFDTVHKYAEEIRRFFECREKAHAAREAALDAEKATITEMIAGMSVAFAKKYDDDD